MVLLMVVCCGCGLKVDRYNCTIPISGLDDPACADLGGVFVCATNGTVKPWLSDDNEGTKYTWQGIRMAYLDLYIPNSVCVEAIVMTFTKPTAQTNLPELTIEPGVPVNISSPPTPDGPVNTTVTFTQPYCGQTVRINMNQESPGLFVVLQEVTLKNEPITPGTSTGVTIIPTSTARNVSVPTTTPPPSSDTPIPLIAGVAAGGLVIILLMVIIVIMIVVLIRKRKLREVYSRVSYDMAQVSNGQTFQQGEVNSEPNKERTFTSSSIVKPSVVDLEKFKRMDENPIYSHPEGEGPVGSEYAEIPREGSIRSACVPPIPAPYRSGSSVSPKFKTVPESVDSVDSGFNIYASADTVVNEGGKFEDIYSEPYDLTTFATEGKLVDKDHRIKSPEDTTAKLGDDWTPYSSVYAMPALLDRSEGPKEIEPCNIQEVKPLGVGQFGEVVLAQTVGLSLKDLKLSETDNDTSVKISVAVKKLKDESQSSTREAFEKEIKFMSRLSHRNVIRLLAVCLKGTPFIVMEYMEEGDLNQFLKKRQFSSTPSDYSNTLDVRGLVDIATQIASGMEYLATMKFIHRDLATRNCLVGKNLTVKIADFGMSQNLYSAYYFRLKGRAVLPIRWMAYECFYGRFSIKSDVWAYGVTIWEVFTLGQRQPFEGWTDQEVIENAVKPSRGGESEKLEKPELCPPELYHLMTQCWCHDSAHRPDFTEICEILSTLNAP
jgi:hypothetical protein